MHTNFLEPVVTQYGSNMIMTNVQKPKKKKYINIDTRFSDEHIHAKHHYNTTDQYIITLPEKINDVKSIYVRSMEIPMSFYNFSLALGNSFIKYKHRTQSDVHMITVPDGNYASSAALLSAISTNNVGSPITFTMGSQGIYMNGSNVYEVDFDVDACGNLDKYHPRSKLGWALGFRDASYVMTGNNIYADSLVNINTVRYVYLVVDEYNNSFPNSFVSPMNQFIMNRKILARLCIDNTIHPFGSVVYGNETNGAIVSDRRTYSGKIDIQRLNVQLVNEWGLPINLNGLDFSFCLELEYE